jgi:Tfp pilus assembly protein PilN
MIEINLLPGAGRRARGRGTGAGLGATLSGVATKVKDPYLLFGTAVTAVCLLAVAALHWQQTALSDSLGEKRSAEARRDSVLRQLEIIRSIDDNRFVWPHLMDEVSRVLPAYTWLTAMTQTSLLPAPGMAADSTRKDSLNVVPPAMKFRVSGNTVDIQALTRFMKDLEASNFVQNVTLEKSMLAVVEGKEVTQFQLTAEYQTPDSSAIRLQPVALSVR